MLAQRLARRLCPKCKEAYEPSEQVLKDAGWPLDQERFAEMPMLFRPVGCTACSNTGYRGRMALHEVMRISEEIEKLCVDHRSSDEIKKQAILEGMRPLKEDGLYKVRDGLTSLEEIARVVL